MCQIISCRKLILLVSQLSLKIGQPPFFLCVLWKEKRFISIYIIKEDNKVKVRQVNKHLIQLLFVTSFCRKYMDVGDIHVSEETHLEKPIFSEKVWVALWLCMRKCVSMTKAPNRIRWNNNSFYFFFFYATLPHIHVVHWTVKEWEITRKFCVYLGCPILESKLFLLVCFILQHLLLELNMQIASRAHIKKNIYKTNTERPKIPVRNNGKTNKKTFNA